MSSDVNESRWDVMWENHDEDGKLIARHFRALLSELMPASRTFRLGEGRVLIGIMPIRRVGHASIEFAVTMSHSTVAHAIGSSPELSVRQIDIDRSSKIFMIVPTLEWAVRLGNGFFESGDRFDLEKASRKLAEVLAELAKPDDQA